MSGIKPTNVAEFYRSLNRRGLTITDLAEAVNCGRSHLSQVFNGHRSGKPTWRKIEAAELLTDHELRCLGRLPAEEKGNVPRDTFSHMEHEPQGVATL